MRIKLLGGVVAAVCLVGMPAAYAQSDENKGADTTCTDFMAMDTADQTALIEQVRSATPDLKTNGADDAAANANASGSMSAPSSTPSGGADSSSAASAAGSADAKAGAAEDSAVDEVIAACQEDSSRSVGDALTR
jgi:hypothetical protein